MVQMSMKFLTKDVNKVIYRSLIKLNVVNKYGKIIVQNVVTDI